VCKPGKIVHIAWLSQVGGGELFLLDLLDAIDRVRFSHELYCIGPTGTLDAAINGLGLPVERFPKTTKLAPTTIWRLASALRRSRPDVVQTHGEAGVFWGIPAALLARSPRLCALLYQNQPQAADKAWAMRRLLPCADVVIGGSENVRRHVVDELGVAAERAEAILCGIDTRAFLDAEAGRERPRERAGRVLLTVGRLVEQKGHAVLLEAMSLLAHRHADVELWIVGEGPERSSLVRRARELRIAERVRFPGTVYPTLDPLLEADIFVFPSLAEPQGLAVLEAMASGVPVVASRTGGIPEMVRDEVDGCLVPPGDAEALAAALSRLLDEPARGAAFAASARERARRFDIRVVARRYEALYDRLIEPRGAAGDSETG
jgi:glycosyltransferase involved in cell wall biosynthesis